MAEFKAGRVTVSQAGTRVAFPSVRKKCLWLRVTANEANSGDVFFGDIFVSSTVGRTLKTGTDEVNNQTEIPFSQNGGGVDLNSIYLDAANNNDYIEYEAILE
jgi:hypothetical protein|tara:strand:- start:1527 stop:1835 length:309 start_codon:yes stop_codon:yes gene_type:complete